MSAAARAAAQATASDSLPCASRSDRIEALLCLRACAVAPCQVSNTANEASSRAAAKVACPRAPAAWNTSRTASARHRSMSATVNATCHHLTGRSAAYPVTAAETPGNSGLGANPVERDAHAQLGVSAQLAASRLKRPVPQVK